MRRIILFTVILLPIFNQIIAQKQVQKDSIKTNKLKEVVVSAQYAPTTEKNAVYKVKVITQKIIQAKAAVNLTELLRQELNVDFSFDPSFGAGIELNGVSKENIKILVDGVPLIGRVKGVLNLNQINIENIERIEVIEGPVSVFYGTDAIGGTINLITKKNQNKAVEGNISGSYESSNFKEINADIGFVEGKNTFRFGAGYNYFNGLNTDEENERSLNWPKKRQYYRNFKYLRELGNFKLQFSSSYSDELVHSLGEIKHHKATDIDYTTRRFDNSLNFQGSLKNNHFIDITASVLNYDRFDVSYKFKPSDNSITLIENNPNENANYFDTYFFKGQFAKSRMSDKFNYVLGIEYNSNKGRGNRILDGKKIIENTSIYGSVNYKILNNIEIQPALRYTSNSSFADFWSPALNLKYRINNNNVIRFAYGRGYRTPSIKELYLDWTPTFGPFTYTFTGNENLKIESSNSYNLYYTYTKQLKGTNNVVIEPAIFYNDIKDLIGLSELVNFERHYINLKENKNITTSLNVKYNVSDVLNVNLGISYLGRYLKYTEEFDSDTFMFSPSINVAMMYHIKPIGLNLNGFFKYTGKRKGHYIEKIAGENVLQETTRDGFSNLDISASKTFFNKKLHIAFGVKNILDVTDVENVNQIGVAHERSNKLWGRSLFVKTILKF